MQGDEVEHGFKAVANHSAVEFIRRKRIQNEISGTMRKRSGITS
jgi:hypothetical protein